MKIIGGTAKGRRLATPLESRSKKVGARAGRSMLIRPTSALAREALFNIIGPAVQNAAVLDLFAGTGALGLEALSRGARSAVFVDQYQTAIALIRENIIRCSCADRSQVVKRDLTRGIFFCVAWPRRGASPSC